MTASTDRTHYRALVAEVAAKAKERLPLSVNGRVESATTLVLLGEVQPQDDGTIVVGSCTDPAKVYHLQGTTCDCADYPRAPDGWCKHRVAAGIDRRVRELLAAEASSTPPPAPPLPEAPASCNVYVMVGSHKVQVTLRDSDEHRMLQRLQTLLAQYPAAPERRPEPPTASQGPEPDEQRWCPKHGDKMQRNHKEGRSWWSHKTTDGWCKGK